MRNLQRILISGEGGQGVQAIAKILADAAWQSGSKITYLANYGVEVRGGVSLGFVQISNQEIGFPKFQNADILVILAKRAIPRVQEYITKSALIIHDETLVPAEKLKGLPNQKIAVPALKTAEEKMIGKVMNMVVLGFLANLVGGISLGSLKLAVEAQFESKYKKNPELKHFNERAIEMGYGEISKSEFLISNQAPISNV